MIYKMLPKQEGEQQIYARIDDDGKCRLTCTAEYPEFQEWLAEGNTLEPAPTPTPEEALAAERAAMQCTPAQMRLTLHRMDLLTQVQAIADADPEASIVWEYATVIERTSPLIDALGGPNGFTDTQIDDIFRAAMQA